MNNPFHHEILSTLNQVYHNTLIPYDGIVQENKHIVTPLYPHQITLIQRMHEYRDRMLNGFLVQNQAIHGKVGVIGDPIGSGKTLSVLAYLASTLPPVPSPVPSPVLSPVPSTALTCELTPFSARYFYSHSIRVVTGAPTANLIIVPHSLFNEWKQEIQTRTTLPYVAIETRRMLRGDGLPQAMTDSTFVLTTNKCYKYVNDYAQQHGIKWNQIFMDEASSIYMNSSDPPLQFQFLWLISNQWIPLLFKSASFHRISLYNLCETTQALHPDLEAWLSETQATPYETPLISSGFLKDYLAFHHPSRHLMVLRNATTQIQQHLQLPPPDIVAVHCRPNISLTSLMSYYLARHLEPTIQSHQVPHLFQTLGVPFYPLETYLPLHLPHKHALIQRKIDDNECVICLERCEHPTMVACCYHLYCGKCLLKSALMSGKCPTCRDQVTPTRMACFTTLLPAERIQTKNKSEVCLDWIRMNPSGRFIIYSSFDNVYYQLFEEIDRLGRKAERIDNHHFSLVKTVKNFKYGTTQILFVSNPELLRGLSFPFITHLLFYHDLPSYEKKQLLLQSAHRLGRTQPLQVIHLHSEIQV